MVAARSFVNGGKEGFCHGSGLRNVQTPPAKTDGSKSNWLKWKVLQSIISMDENMKMDEKWLNRDQLVKYHQEYKGNTRKEETKSIGEKK